MESDARLAFQKTEQEEQEGNEGDEEMRKALSTQRSGLSGN
jgi:hypothetical protein